MWLFKSLYRLFRKKSAMSRDVISILDRWPDNPSPVTARIIAGHDGQPQLQLRIDCGVLQMDLDGRPDGARPHRYPTFLDYLLSRANAADKGGPWLEALAESPREAWAELDRELTQFYHRRLALLGVARAAQDADDPETAKDYYQRAAADAHFTLRAMNFIRDHCNDEEHVGVHERLRPFVLWHHTIAVTQKRIIEKDFDEAIEQIKSGMGEITKAYKKQGLTKWMRHDPSIAELREMEKRLRNEYGIKATLHEQLASAVHNEQFEQAAKLRDKLQARGRFRVPLKPRAAQAPLKF